ncbi:bifunctional diguanylate cyclase/phosphodiesterase [Shewanella avicenniae]|uniref:Bifunctional diguanylate cyclase/phosphodiesterase n=1 Tax=Shewanella avicenniae TaxID=2814294 RepID=A0ABX7QPN1_9GAMM|nr:bifunctional diguanylate cyclase/phosphodiesterase [Shewanella avicenniae]QSX32835.1 bifunctional diguanylate cyclase/phosphodiesterase [Shewanella avicenniae]
MIYLISTLLVVALLLLAAVACRYNHLKRFINKLANNVREQADQRQPLEFAEVPELMMPLYTAFKALLRQLPSSIGRDALTGLPNRAMLKKTLTPLMPITKGSLVLLNIEKFRFVNDLFGFNTGDKVLQAFALRLRQLESQPRFVARMDGDEFLLFYENEVSYELLQQMQQLVQQPYVIDNAPIGLKTKIGCLQLAKDHADISLMLRRVDLALKKAAQSHHLIAIYETGDDTVNLREMKIINSLPRALNKNQLYLVYQPKESLETGQCLQVEALIRWDHSELGFISPAEFIPLAECAGMQGLVSDWVMDNAMAQISRWQRQGIDLRVAVNLSSSDFEKDIVAIIADKLKAHNIPATALAVELTEGTLVADMQDTRTKLRQLREMGIEVAIDDFGTGHSSLAYLKDLPVDEIKIDRAFLQDLLTDVSALHIMRSSIQLAHQLGFRVTVEGVETKAQREALRKLGADVIQGQYYANPMRAAELEYHGINFHLFSKMEGQDLTH